MAQFDDDAGQHAPGYGRGGAGVQGAKELFSLPFIVRCPSDKSCKCVRARGTRRARAERGTRRAS